MTEKRADDRDNPAATAWDHLASDSPGVARRRLLRALGGSSLAAGTVVASGWHKPVVRAVVLPAHAQISGLAIACTVEDTEGPCDTDATGAVEFRVFGTVTGAAAGGAVLEIEYRNELQIVGTDPGPFASFTTTTIVQPDNSFDATVLALPPAGEFWHEPEAEVAVRFQDPDTYGPAECSDTHDCSETGPVP